MTVVINVEPIMNGEAVRRLLARARAQRVVFNLPEGWTELDNMARMRLLQRQAQLLRKDVALITEDDATRTAAKQVGVPVFTHPEDALHGNWQIRPVSPLVDPRQPESGLPEAPHWEREDLLQRIQKEGARQTRQHRIHTEKSYRRPTPTWLRWSWNIAAGAIIILFLSGFAFYILPAATITLTPGQETIAVAVPLTADPTLDVADVEDGLLTARLVETNISEQGTTRTTGSSQRAAGVATGSVVFSNLSNAAVRIPAGTIVSTGTGTPVNFRTTNEVEVPGGFNESVSAFIEAVEPGTQGNVQSNTITTVSGALRSRVRVTNPAPTSNGGSQLVSVVTQEDRDRLLAETTARAEADAYQRLQEGLNEGEWLPPESVQTFVIAQAFTGFNDEAADELALDMNVLAQGTAVEDALISEAALAALRNAVPQRGQLVADTITFQREPGAVSIGRTVAFTVTARAEYVVPVDPDEVRELVAGLTPEEAIAAMQSRWPLARPPEIYRDPELLPTLPTIPSRMQVRIEYENALSQ